MFVLRLSLVSLDRSGCLLEVQFDVVVAWVVLIIEVFPNLMLLLSFHVDALMLVLVLCRLPMVVLCV